LVSGEQTGSSFQSSDGAGSFEAFEAEAGHAQSQSAQAGAVSANSDSKGVTDGTEGSDRASEFNSSVSGESTSLGSESLADLQADKQSIFLSDKEQKSAASRLESAGALQEPSLEQLQDQKPNDKTSAWAGQPNSALMPDNPKDSVSAGQDEAGQMQDKTGSAQDPTDKKRSLSGIREEPMASTPKPQERLKPGTTSTTIKPTAATGPFPLQSDLSSASSLSATLITNGDGSALPQAASQTVARPESGAAEGPIQAQTLATPLAEEQAKDASRVSPSLFSRLVAWYAKTFKH
jgi:hypothetical protein